MTGVASRTTALLSGWTKLCAATPKALTADPSAQRSGGTRSLTRLFTQAIQCRLIGYSVEVFAESFGENAGTIGCTREESDRGMKFQIVGVAKDVVNCPAR